MSKRNIILKLTLILVLLMPLLSCNQSDTSSSFKGESEAVKLANDMLDAIGGYEKWCKLKSLYIKANHWETNIDGPYESEIWRSMDTFSIRIEQKHETFHVQASITSKEGKVSYLDQRDTFRILNNYDLLEWKHEHEHNVYVALHNVACTPQLFTVTSESDTKLAFYKGAELYFKVELDEKLRPYIYHAPDLEGKLTSSIFTKWGTDEGLVHSAGGHPMDSSFIYRTEIWRPAFETDK